MSRKKDEVAMPSRPNTPCRHSGCAALVPAGTKYCEEHKALRPEEARSVSARGYGRAWQRARKRYLEAHSLCVKCQRQGKYIKATVVDHVIPHRGDAGLFWDQNNWQPLCKKCHDQKTRREDQTPTYRYSG